MHDLALGTLLALLAAPQDAMKAGKEAEREALTAALLRDQLDVPTLREVIEDTFPRAGLDKSVAWHHWRALMNWSGELEESPDRTRERIELLERGRLIVALQDTGWAAWLAIEEARHLNDVGLDGRAQEVCLEALEGLSADAKQRAWVLRQLGEQARFRRDVGAARAWLEEARAACRPETDFDHVRLEAMIEVSDARVLLDMGLTDQAAPFLDAAEAALERARETARREPKASWPVYTELEYECARVRHALALGRERAAAEHGAEVLARWDGRDEAGLPFLCERIRCLVGIAWLHEQPSEAEDAFERVLASPDSGEWDRVTAGMWLAHLRLAAGDGARARTLVDDVHRRIEAMDAQANSRVPGRELGVLAALELRLAALDEGPEAARRHMPALRDAFETMIADWRDAPRRAGGTSFLRYYPARFVVSTLLDATFDLEPEDVACQRALEHLFEAQTVGTVFLDRNGGRPLPHFDRSDLPAGVSVLVYFLGTHRLHVFALHRDDARHQQVPAQGDGRYEEFSRLVATAPEAGGPGRSRRLVELGTELAEELLPSDLLALAREREVVAIVGRDMLADLPFEALPGPGGRPLGVELALEHWYSLPLGGLLSAASASPRDAPACLVVAPRHGPRVRADWPELVELPMTERDRAALVRAMRPQQAHVLNGEGARLDAVRDALADATHLHFVTHGVTAPDQERSAALVLAPDGNGRELLTSAEIDEWRVPPLVVLSSCGSGSGPMRVGDAGASHLGGAFLRAGAQAVVLSAYPVPYASTIELARGFERVLAAGASPAEALRKARAEVWARAGGDDPYRYALPHVVGAGHVSLYPRPAQRGGGAWLAALGGGVVIAVVLTRRRRTARPEDRAARARSV